MALPIVWWHKDFLVKWWNTARVVEVSCAQPGGIVDLDDIPQKSAHFLLGEFSSRLQRKVRDLVDGLVLQGWPPSRIGAFLSRWLGNMAKALLWLLDEARRIPTLPQMARAEAKVAPPPIPPPFLPSKTTLFTNAPNN